MIRLLFALLFLLISEQASASGCDSVKYPPNNLNTRWECANKTFGETINSGVGQEDKDECSMPLSEDNLLTFTKKDDVPWHWWVYKTKDKSGISGACVKGKPTANDTYTFHRTGHNTEEAQYHVTWKYCIARNQSGGSGAADIAAGAVEGATNLFLDVVTLGGAIAKIEKVNVEVDTRQDQYCGNDGGDTVTFKAGEVVGIESSTGYKVVGGIQPVCVVNYKKGDVYRHTEPTKKHEGALNKVCAYLLVAGAPDCTSPYAFSWDHALIGCLTEPPYPGPDVFNSVIPSDLAPYVDYSLCLDEAGNGPRGCDKSKSNADNLVARGSTFDRPVIVLAGGDGRTMALQYTFYNDSAPDGLGIPRCGRFDSDLGFSSKEYCAQVLESDPSKVCACERGLTPGSITPLGYVNYCGNNEPIGCTDRPTLEHSNLKLVAEFESKYDDHLNKKYPTVKPSFVRTDEKNNILYVDSNGDDVCLSVTDDQYYVCDDNRSPTSAPAIAPIRYKERLRLPTGDTPPLREYYLNIPNKDYTCTDVDGDPARLDEDAKFYKVDSEGAITTNETSVRFENCEGFVFPSGYERDSMKVYGIEFTAAIAKQDAGNIKFGRYTSDKDELKVNKVCTPIKMTNICALKGTTNFVPDGERSAAFCVIPNMESCGDYDKGEHEDEALSIYCPGSYLGPTSSDTPPGICILPSYSWNFETIEGYKKDVELSGSLAKLAANCNRKIDFASKCASVIMGARRVDVPSEESGYAKWPDIEPGQSANGICDGELGYQKYTKLYPYTPDFNRSKTQVCANNNDMGVSCDDFYQAYKSEGTQLINRWITEEKAAYDNYRNYTWQDAGKFMYAFNRKYLNKAYFEYWYNTFTPKKTCSTNGTCTITNHCVIKP